MGFLEGKRYFFKNRIFGKNHGKTLPKHSQIPPQTSQNPVKNHRKTLKKSTLKHLVKRTPKKCDLGANLKPTCPPIAKTSTYPMEPDGTRRDTRRPLRGAALRQKAWDDLNPKVQHTWGTRPPRIVTLRGSARGSILENLP